MRLGFNLPQLGPAASPEAIIQVARRAEELGYDSLWVTDRLVPSPQQLRSAAGQWSSPFGTSTCTS